MWPVKLERLMSQYRLPLKLQQAASRPAVKFTTQPRNEFGNQTQLVGRTEGLHRLPCLVVTWVRQVAHPHVHAIPPFVLGAPVVIYRRSGIRTQARLCQLSRS